MTRRAPLQATQLVTRELRRTQLRRSSPSMSVRLLRPMRRQPLQVMACFMTLMLWIPSQQEAPQNPVLLPRTPSSV